MDVGTCIYVFRQGILYDRITLQNLKEAKQAKPNVSGAVIVLCLCPIKFSVAFTETRTILDFQSRENLMLDFVVVLQKQVGFLHLQNNPL